MFAWAFIALGLRFFGQGFHRIDAPDDPDAQRREMMNVRVQPIPASPKQETCSAGAGARASAQPPGPIPTDDAPSEPDVFEFHDTIPAPPWVDEEMEPALYSSR
ncbi:MAG TPA: hypothetical protein VKY73_06910 [Polyangiaceae bacterium]|nr:hypothetical protein [Polyangiaceae bacterium]